MTNQRILSHHLSQKIALDELEQVSAAAGSTSVGTLHATYSAGGGKDFDGDLTVDF